MDVKGKRVKNRPKSTPLVADCIRENHVHAGGLIN